MRSGKQKASPTPDWRGPLVSLLAVTERVCELQSCRAPPVPGWQTLADYRAGGTPGKDMSRTGYRGSVPRERARLWQPGAGSSRLKRAGRTAAPITRRFTNPAREALANTKEGGSRCSAGRKKSAFAR
jgi:hypothetical protein